MTRVINVERYWVGLSLNCKDVYRKIRVLNLVDTCQSVTKFDIIADLGVR